MHLKTVAITSLVLGVAYAFWVQLKVPVEVEEVEDLEEEEIVFPVPSAPPVN